MKKLVFASAMVLASICLAITPALRAQDAGQITIQDPAEFNAYQNFSTQTDPAQKCAAGESFLTTYPQSVVKKAVLDELIGCYEQTNQPDKVLSAASRLLQVDPNNMKAIYISVFIKKGQCSKNLDASGMSHRSPDLRRRGGAGPEGADCAEAGRHVGRRLEEVDRRHIPRISLGYRF